MGILEQVLAQVDNAKRMVGRNAQDLYNDPAAYADKIVGHLRNTNTGVSPTIAGGELTNRVLSPSERTEQVMGSLDFGGGLGVIKPKGGNWLSGRYGPEAQLKGLKSEGRTLEQAIAESPVPLDAEGAKRLGAMQFWPTAAQATQNSALNSFVDNQLTKYVKNDMGAPTDPIRKMADAWQGEKATKLEAANAKIQALRAKQEAQAATRGVPEEYLTRTRQDVLSAEEARDLIAENSGLHYTPGYTAEPLSGTVKRRAAGGFPEEGMAQTDLGRIWENTVDSEIGRGTVSDYQLPNNLKSDPWLAKADPEAPVYNLAGSPGFSHLADELSNSLREGRLTPEQLSKMPIDQAVRHVAEINALRAVKSKKEQAMEMAGMPLHKDYPEQSMSWRQLQHADEPTLQKWLTQEGDAMGHCVGGSCPDVQSGASSIYSLRDTKGQPHVTIETRPAEIAAQDIESPQAQTWINERAKQYQNEYGDDAWDVAFEDYTNLPLPKGTIIAQIKGPKNGAPAAEHLPFIQDFIRSGKWSDVQDLKNAGMHKVGNAYHTMDELKATLARRTPEGRPILDQQGVDATDAMQRWIEDQDLNRI